MLIPAFIAFLLLPRMFLAILTYPERSIATGTASAAFFTNYSDSKFDAISKSSWVTLGLPTVSLALFGVCLYNTLRYLPGVGDRAHNRGQFIKGVLLPLVGTVLAFITFDSFNYLGGKFANQSDVGPLLLWATVPSVGALLMFVILKRRSLKERFELLRSPLLLAVIAMAAGAGVATWATENFLLWNPDPKKEPPWSFYVTVGPSAILFGYALSTILFAGLSSGFLKDTAREWLSRCSAGVLLACVGWATFGALVLALPSVAIGWRSWGAGAIALGGALSAFLSRFSPTATPTTGSSHVSSRKRATPLSLAAKAAPFAFISLLAITLSIVTNRLLCVTAEVLETARSNLLKMLQFPLSFRGVLGPAKSLANESGRPPGWLEHEAILSRTSLTSLLVLALAMIAVSWLMSRYVDINTFSLHGMYRDRLVRAYLGASNSPRHPSPFTDFDPDDDLEMSKL